MKTKVYLIDFTALQIDFAGYFSEPVDEQEVEEFVSEWKVFKEKPPLNNIFLCTDKDLYGIKAEIIRALDLG